MCDYDRTMDVSEDVARSERRLPRSNVGSPAASYSGKGDPYDQPGDSYRAEQEGYPRHRTVPLPSPTEDAMGEPVTQEPVADGRRCPDCGHVASRDQKFCSQCGRSLWLSCFACGATCAADEKYCGRCGSNLAEARQIGERQCREALTKARSLAETGHFAQAIQLLAEVAESETPGTTQHVQRAGKLMEKLNRLQRSEMAKAEEAASAAKKLISAGNFARALSVLQRILPGLRSAVVDQLIQECQERVQEIQALEQHLKDAAAQRSGAKVLAAVNRLLLLQPEHPLAIRYASSIRERAKAHAEQAIKAFRYQQAWELLQKIPGPVWDEQTAMLHAVAFELVYLTKQIEQSACIHPALKDTLSRFRELVPQDEERIRRCNELEERLKKAVADPRQLRARVKADPAPKDGPSIEWLSGFQRIVYGPEVCGELLWKYAGCFCAACGLALQGLGQTEINFNLLPDDHRPWYARVAQAFRSRQPGSAWGLDLGQSGLKCARLSIDETGEIALTHVDVLEHRKPLSQAADDEEEKRIINETLSRFVEQHDEPADRVCLGLPSRRVFLRVLKMPPLPAEKMEAALPYEAKRVLVGRLDQHVWRYQVFSDEEQPHAEHIDVLFAAAKRFPVIDRIARLADLGVEVDVVQSSSVAVLNLWLYEGASTSPGESAGKTNGKLAAPLAQTRSRRQHFLLIDGGGDATTMLAGGPGGLLVRASGVGGNLLTQQIAREFRVTLAHAEQIKRQPLRAPSLLEYHQLMENLYGQLFEDVQRVVQGRPEFDKVLLCGGAFLSWDMLEFFLQHAPAYFKEKPGP